MKLDYKDLATIIRRDVLRMTTAAGSGHPGGSLSSADIFAVLYGGRLEHSPENWSRTGEGQDVFILSAGHLAPALYSALARTGYFDVNELSTLRQFGSRLQGHPSIEQGLPGIYMSAGSLGQGISVAVGFALAKRAAGDDHRVYVLCGDGELEEGQNYEALMLAAKEKLSNLTIIVDSNNAQIDGTVKQVGGFDDMTIARIADAFGIVFAMCDGNDVDDIDKSLFNLQLKQFAKGKPAMLIACTTMGYPIDFMMKAGSAYHGKTLTSAELEHALEQIPSTMKDY